MSEYEVADLTHNAMNMFLTAFGVFISVVTAYIVATYMAASKLTALQLSIVNGCFLVSVGILGYLVIGNFKAFYVYAAMNFENSFGQSADRPILVDFSLPLTILLAGIVLGSLVFMYSVRQEAKT